ncbi:hypothetical protein [Streptomyces sp. NPDC051776]|uniref:hypothetical protein n=1 Tax=Streptomyces sp. NPDC051776 TaxID=3155414 RepID=UPI003437BB0C
MGSEPRIRLSRPFRMPRRAAVVVAAAALCSAVALPAYAVDEDPVEETPASSSAGTTTDDPLSDPGSDPLSDPLTESLSDEFGDETGDVASSSAPSSSENLKITPSVVAPGAEVEIRIQGLKETKATKVVVRSEVFVTEARLAADSRGGLFGEAKVKSSASPGRYTVTCDCGVKATITIVASHGGTGGPHESPTAPVRAGGGGTAVLAPAAAEKEDGPGLAHFVVAAGLAGGAALAFAGIAVRRRRADTAGD